MRSIYEYISESLLDDEDEISSKIDHTYLFKSLLNAKTSEEFNSRVEDLKQQLDDEYGVNYEGNIKRSKNNRSRIYMCISLQKYSDSRSEYMICLSFGGSKSYVEYFWRSAHRPHICEYKYTMNTFLKQATRIEKVCMWELDESWRPLIDFIEVNAYK